MLRTIAAAVVVVLTLLACTNVEEEPKNEDRPRYSTSIEVSTEDPKFECEQLGWITADGKFTTEYSKWPRFLISRCRDLEFDKCYLMFYRGEGTHIYDCAVGAARLPEERGY